MGRQRHAHGKIALRYGLIDETFALCQPLRVPDGIDRFWIYTWITALNLLYWVAPATIGSLVAANLPVDLTGLDFIIKALFIVIFLNCWMEESDHRASIIGLACSLACLAIFGSDSFIVVALLSIVTVLLLARKQLGPDGASATTSAAKTAEATETPERAAEAAARARGSAETTEADAFKEVTQSESMHTRHEEGAR